MRVVPDPERDRSVVQPSLEAGGSRGVPGWRGTQGKDFRPHASNFDSRVATASRQPQGK